MRDKAEGPAKLPDGLLRYPIFYWRCACEAAEGTVEKANSWAWAIGSGVIWLVVFIRGQGGVAMPSTGHWGEFVTFTFEMGVVSIVIAWLVIFAFRLVGAPVRLYEKLQKTIPPIPDSDIRLTLHEGLIYEAGEKDSEGRDLPPAMVFLVNIENVGHKLIRDCQLKFGYNSRQSYPASKMFNLRRGENRDVPVLRVERNNNNPRAFLYFLNPATWEISSNGGAWLPAPGRYEITALSADSAPSRMDVELIADQALTVPEKWHLRGHHVANRSAK